MDAIIAASGVTAPWLTSGTVRYLLHRTRHATLELGATVAVFAAGFNAACRFAQHLFERNRSALVRRARERAASRAPEEMEPLQRAIVETLLEMDDAWPADRFYMAQARDSFGRGCVDLLLARLASVDRASAVREAFRAAMWRYVARVGSYVLIAAVLEDATAPALRARLSTVYAASVAALASFDTGAGPAAVTLSQLLEFRGHASLAVHSYLGLGALHRIDRALDPATAPGTKLAAANNRDVASAVFGATPATATDVVITGIV